MDKSVTLKRFLLLLLIVVISTPVIFFISWGWWGLYSLFFDCSSTYDPCKDALSQAHLVTRVGLFLVPLGYGWIASTVAFKRKFSALHIVIAIIQIGIMLIQNHLTHDTWF